MVFALIDGTGRSGGVSNPQSVGVQSDVKCPSNTTFWTSTSAQWPPTSSSTAPVGAIVVAATHPSNYRPNVGHEGRVALTGTQQLTTRVTSATIAGAAVAGVAGIVLGGLAFLMIRRRRRTTREPAPWSSPGIEFQDDTASARRPLMASVATDDGSMAMTPYPTADWGDMYAWRPSSSTSRTMSDTLSDNNLYLSPGQRRSSFDQRQSPDHHPLQPQRTRDSCEAAPYESPDWQQHGGDLRAYTKAHLATHPRSPRVRPVRSPRLPSLPDHDGDDAHTAHSPPSPSHSAGFLLHEDGGGWSVTRWTSCRPRTIPSGMRSASEGGRRGRRRLL